MRYVDLVARTSMSHNRSKGSVDETNALCPESVCVAEQHEKHHIPRDL